MDSKSLTYIGLEDFGENMESTGLKANHTLVFMFQSLCTNLSQPTAVFASRGPVKGLFVCSNQRLKYTESDSLFSGLDCVFLLLYINN